MWIFFVLIGLGLVLILSSVKMIYQYERGVKFTLGQFSGLMEPGLRLVIPFFQEYRKVDMRQTTIDLEPQRVMTKDNVSLTIDGVIFYLVDVPEDTVLNVSNLEKQIEDKATSELKEIIGSKSMTDSLSQREKIAEELIEKLNSAVSDEKEKDDKKRKSWGIKIRAVQINNIQLPEELVRAMSKQAEAEREAEARHTKAKGEKDASQEFKEASLIYKDNPTALKLRELQTFQEIGTEHNSLMIVIPSEMLNSGNANWILPYGRHIMDKDKKKKE